MAKKKQLVKLSDFEKNKENPFLKQALEEINHNVIKKYKTATKTGQKAILQAIDPNTGEVVGHTQFIRQIEVDEQQFAKFYLSNFSAFFDLKPSAIRVFGYILEQLTPNRDDFIFWIDEAMEKTGYKNKSSVYEGLASLVANEVIARGKSDNHYFINPMIVFNGNRITFAKTYIKKKKKLKIEDKNQMKIQFDNEVSNQELEKNFQRGEDKHHQVTLEENIQAVENENQNQS